MKHDRILSVLALALIFSLLLLTLPVTPALAAPTITLSPTSGPVGTVIAIDGSGFTPGASGYVWFDSNGNSTRDTGEPQVGVEVSITGEIAGVTLIVASVPRGTYQVRADIPIGTPVEASASFAVTPKITLSPSSGCVGDTVTVEGSGFAASVDITIYFDTTSVKTATSTSTGALSSTTFTVPASVKGSHTIKAEETSAPTNNATTVFNVTPKVNINPTSGSVGDTVTVSGSGFAASSAITIYFDNNNVATAQTNTSGSFPNTTFTVPTASRGSHTIKALDAAGNFATATFTLAAKITISPTSGAPGMTVTVSGSGFAANKRITIKYSGEPVDTTPATVNTDATGSFSASFVVPASEKGTYAVQATDGTNTASADFAVTINLTLSPTTSEASPGYVGMSMTVSGTGFLPNRQVTITYESEKKKVATTQSDSSGAFSATFKIPKSKHGPHTITATDGTNTLEATFYMESTPPAKPKLLLPAKDAKTKSRPVFDWGDVDEDINGDEELSQPVTYDLQIAADSDFDNIVLEKTELSSSEYTLIKGEKLESTGEGAPYYWRVRAVDAASNAGDWTKPRTFYVSGLDWVRYVLIAAGVLVVFLIGFWAGRRSGRSAYY